MDNQQRPNFKSQQRDPDRERPEQDSNNSGAPNYSSGTGAPNFGSGSGAPNFSSGTGAPNFSSGTGAPNFSSGTGAPNFGSGTGSSGYGASGQDAPGPVQDENVKHRRYGNSGNTEFSIYASAGPRIPELPEEEVRDLFQVGDTIGGTYTILSHIGRGGMGQVFTVEHVMLRQKYALKVLSGDSPSSSGWKRFQTEARTIAKLNHPNIVRVHNLGIHDDRVPYYVMELLDGETLSSQVRKDGPLDPEAVIDLFLPLCDGLAYAHAHGIIHRDIKPSNIMLVAAGRKIVPKLVDFGLVKLVGDALSASQQLTATGEVFGSPLYMSPEQSVGRHINERSDIYSLGCTMFEALTGAPPFVGENVVQTILKHQNEAAPTLKQASMGLEFSPEWEAVIKRSLAKEASDRYQTMDELASDLKHIKEGRRLCKRYATTGDGDLFSEEEEKQEAKRKSNILLVASTVAALGLAVAVGSYLAIQNRGPAKGAHVDGLNYGGVQKEAAVLASLDEDKQLEDIKTPFVQNGGKPIDGYKVFNFPANVNLGALNVTFADKQKKVLDLDAMGQVKVPADGTITFAAGRICGIHPKIFRKFLADDLGGLILYADVSDTDDELYFLNHMTNLKVLNLDASDVTGKGLKLVDELPDLSVLSVTHTKGLAASDLAKLKCLPRLTRLDFARNENPTPFLEALKGSTNMHVLNLDGTPLTAADIKLIATMPHLNALSINNCHISTADLEPLAALPDLQNLGLRSNDISPQFIDMFKGHNNLSWFELSDPKWSQADKARLDAEFHKRYRFRDTADSKISVD